MNPLIAVRLITASTADPPPLPHSAACLHAAVCPGGAHLGHTSCKVMDSLTVVTGLSSHVMDSPASVQSCRTGTVHCCMVAVGVAAAVAAGEAGNS
jgi:hypothetical protein